MTTDETTRGRSLRQLREQAIQLATRGRWEEAVQWNRAILQVAPRDVDALNRLGKALAELGQYEAGREAYRMALEAEPANTIARKNLQRLEQLAGAGAVSEVREGVEKVDPRLFIEDTGRTGMAQLARPNLEALKAMVPGDVVRLRESETGLVVDTPAGVLLGEIEPKIGLRLASLIRGGNTYMAAIAAVDERGARVFIKETYQSPENEGKVSFSVTPGEMTRGYVRGDLLHYEEDEEYEEEQYAEAHEFGEEEPPAEESELPFSQYQRAVERGEEEEETE